MKRIILLVAVLSLPLLVLTQTNRSKDSLSATLLIKQATAWRQDSLDNHEALRIAKQASAIAGRSKVPLPMGNSLIQIGLAQKNLGMPDSAFYNLQLAATIFNRMGNNERAASAYNNMSTVKEMMGDYNEGIGYAKRAIKLWPADLTSKIARTYNNTAKLFESLDKIDSAIHYNQQAIKLLKARNFPDSSAWMDAEYGLGKRLIAKGLYSEARKHIDILLELGKLQHDDEMLAYGHESLGVIESNAQNFGEAEKSLQNAKDLYVEIGDSSALAFLYESLGDLYVKKEDNKLAIPMYESALSYHAAAYNPHFKDAIGLKKELCVNNIRLERLLNIIKWLAVAAVIGIFIGIVLSFRLLSEKRKSYIVKEELLKAKEAGLTAQAELIRTQEEIVLAREAAVKEKERVAFLKHSVIKNSVHTILNILPNLPPSDPSYKALSAVKRFVLKMLREVDGTFMIPLPSITLRSFVEEMGELATYCSAMAVKLQSEIDDARNYKITSIFRDNIEFIVENAFANIRKHATCNTASLNFLVDENGLTIGIEDDGIGFDPTKIRKEALGLEHIRKMASEMNGYCRIESSPGRGTKIKVVVPSSVAFMDEQ